MASPELATEIWMLEVSADGAVCVAFARARCHDEGRCLFFFGLTLIACMFLYGGCILRRLQAIHNRFFIV